MNTSPKKLLVFAIATLLFARESATWAQTSPSVSAPSASQNAVARVAKQSPPIAKVGLAGPEAGVTFEQALVGHPEDFYQAKTGSFGALPVPVPVTDPGICNDKQCVGAESLGNSQNKNSRGTVVISPGSIQTNPLEGELQESNHVFQVSE